MHSLPARRDRGIALITAMLVMALAAIAAAAVLGSANAAIRRSATLIDGERAWWYATGVESWVRSILARDRRDSQLDGMGEDWARPVDFLPIEQGGLRGGLEDLQGRFNLNNLASSKQQVYLQQWQRLFRVLELDAGQAQPSAAAILDWIDVNTTPTTGGAEDDEYQGRELPYRAANQPLKSPSELLAIKGINREIWAKLAPLVTALPLNGQGPTPLNVNTAKKEVLMALSDKMVASKVDSWEQSRVKDPVENPQKLYAPPFDLLPADVTPDLLSTSSDFFQLDVTAFIGSGQVHLYSVLQRPASGPPIVIARSLGTE